MKVALMISRLGTGGAEKQVLRIGIRLARQGYDVSIHVLYDKVASPRWHPAVLEAELAKVKFWFLGENIVSRRIPIAALTSSLFVTAPDVIWSWGIRADIGAFLFSLRMKRVKLFSSCRSARPKHTIIERLVYSLTGWRFSGVVSNSRRGSKLAATRAWMSSDLVYYLRNDLALDASLSGKSARISASSYLTLGMLATVRIRTKGYDRLLEIANECRRRRLSVRFMCAGKNDEAAWLKRAIQKMELDSMVEYVGESLNSTNFLSQLDVFLLLSRYEGTSNALLEAMAAELPCIAMDVGDIKEIFTNGIDIFLIERFSIVQICDIIQSIIADRRSSAMIGIRARLRVLEFYSENEIQLDLRRILFAFDRTDR